ncbi:MAG: hypothetical protein ABI745_02775 [Caldimonas sp.]
MTAIAPSVQTLLGGARARLWREEGRRAVRRAAWASAAAVVLVAAAHVSALGVTAHTATALIGAIWLALAAWAVGRRPTDATAALWIDRRLGGASAFTTLLDESSSANRAAPPHALAHLARWAAARVPDAERLLADQRSPTRIAPALLSMGVCIALALVVLALPDARSTLGGPASASDSTSTSTPTSVERAQASTPAPDRAAATQVASDLSRALRANESPLDPEQRAAREPAPGPADPARRDGPPPPSPNLARSGDAPSSRLASSSAPDEATAAAGSLQPSEKVSGRNAGDSRDERADAGVSRMAGGTMVLKRAGSDASTTRDRQADMTRVAGFDDSSAEAVVRAARGALVAAAATPPPATNAARLSPAETHYVQAWMKASGRNP